MFTEEIQFKTVNCKLSKSDLGGCGLAKGQLYFALYEVLFVVQYVLCH